jgi:hypothetical protein
VGHGGGTSGLARSRRAASRRRVGGRARRVDGRRARGCATAPQRPAPSKTSSTETVCVVKPIVYDAGVLIAADRGERRTWAEHRIRLEAGIVPVVPSPVVAQVSRSSRQVQMRRLLRGCEVVAFDETAAHRAGALLGKSHTADVVDASVVALAVERRADIQTGDASDIERLIGAARAKVAIRGI